ncbi:MAG TPA: FHA domain-containing protein, partial [Tepidisphaeraceae bacterium]
MGLQVRLRHALGERVVELPDRDVSRPWVIGRGNEADLKIPSVGVAPQHAALFVHEGHWVVQGYGGTVTLNGEALEMAAALRIGDVIGLGCEPHPPTLEIDPINAAQGRTGPALATLGAFAGSAARRETTVAPKVAPIAKAGISSAGSAPARASTAASADFGAGVRRPIRPDVPIDTDEPAPPPGEADGDTIAWDPQTPTPATTEFYIPKGRQTP